MSSLPSKAIVVLTIVVLVLIVVASLFLAQTQPSISRSEANRIFASQCQLYAQRGCTWSATREPQFASYMEACRTLHGEERQASSCLYALCPACQEIRLADAQCDGLCNICKGNAAIGIDTAACKAQHDAQCAGRCDL